MLLSDRLRERLPINCIRSGLPSTQNTLATAWLLHARGRQRIFLARYSVDLNQAEGRVAKHISSCYGIGKISFIMGHMVHLFVKTSDSPRGQISFVVYCCRSSVELISTWQWTVVILIFCKNIIPVDSVCQQISSLR